MNVTTAASLSLSSLMGKLNRTPSLLISIVLQRILSIGLIRYEKKIVLYTIFFLYAFLFCPTGRRRNNIIVYQKTCYECLIKRNCSALLMNPLQTLYMRKKTHTKRFITVGRVFSRLGQFGSRSGVVIKLVKFDFHTLSCAPCVWKNFNLQTKTCSTNGCIEII